MQALTDFQRFLPKSSILLVFPRTFASCTTLSLGFGGWKKWRKIERGGITRCSYCLNRLDVARLRRMRGIVTLPGGVNDAHSKWKGY